MTFEIWRHYHLVIGCNTVIILALVAMDEIEPETILLFW